MSRRDHLLLDNPLNPHMQLDVPLYDSELEEEGEEIDNKLYRNSLTLTGENLNVDELELTRKIDYPFDVQYNIPWSQLSMLRPEFQNIFWNF